jgi:hypothetical protein
MNETHPLRVFLHPNYFKALTKGANVFCSPSFLNQDVVAQFLNSCPKRKKDKATKLVNMIRELRYAMGMLSGYPVLVDTGQYQPKYQTRTFSDRENEIARDLTTQQNFQAKVKLLGGEHVIQTQKPPAGLTGSPLAERIDQIQAQTRKNYCKPRLEVECEIRERQERLKAVENKSNPTSTTSTQPQRTRRRRAEETPPAWS